jgi:hypothetical protein
MGTRPAILLGYDVIQINRRCGSKFSILATLTCSGDPAHPWSITITLGISFNWEAASRRLKSVT